MSDSSHVVTSSGDEYVPKDDSEEVWKMTSKWREFQLMVLKMSYANSSLESVAGGNLQAVILPEDSHRILLPNVFITSGAPTVDLNKAQRKFYNKVSSLYESTDEPPVDSVTNDLLYFTDYESPIFHYRPRPRINMTWKSHLIVSESDYGVYSDKSRGTNPQEYFLVVEDKRPGSGGFIQAERQLAGEMLIAAYNRAEIIMRDHEIFGMIVKGVLVRFYRCTFSERYLRGMARGGHPPNATVIHRYPPDNVQPLSVAHPNQREILVRLLCSIREHLEATVGA